MSLDTISLELQEVFLIAYGGLIFYLLVFTVVATVCLAAVLPFLTMKERR